ncbi:cupin domain-containing protein [Arthrobacter sp. BF1]|uniref:cupin domain-containing protein n=1 Tax=Arthrobacter sp. BF1 TaxID=2821145 RepID=UPI001C4F8240|nr:cupin domain-containing protein [Arthrobacter sp. BF1]
MTQEIPLPIFPGGTALTRLAVYDWEAGGEPPGGTPHMHTASTEAYLVVGGTGQVETLSAGGFAVHDLAVGDLLWFSPGTIHRLINSRGLDLLVVMQNAGLPEAGDAVMTFSPETLSDPVRYALAAGLPANGAGAEELLAAVAARRNAALAGYRRLKEAALAGNLEPLAQFHEQAVALIKGRVPQWRHTWEESVAAQTTATEAWLAGLERGEFPHFEHAATVRAQPAGSEPTLGMCGLLQTWGAGNVAVSAVGTAT